ncbi:MAG: GNAT family N-acetyltransferase [Bacteroidaceae bacterium]|nr:GNAT family N-acetyltransferase [Bacteroidaceae bacterium]MBQ2979951.1 GNAT family N-acetyltransferase [Bacteroidaceae bacterium]
MFSYRHATINDVSLIRSLADGVWQATYASILSPEQIEYMFEMMYSHENLTMQMRDKHHHFIIIMRDEEPCAYISIEPLGEGRYNFQKIYARLEVHGLGVGRYMIEQGVEWVKECERGHNNDIVIELFVNRANPAVGFYRHMGFEIVNTRDHDIGNGFFMNDYIMERTV